MIVPSGGEDFVDHALLVPPARTITDGRTELGRTATDFAPLSLLPTLYGAGQGGTVRDAA
jgi:hypothetical protein